MPDMDEDTCAECGHDEDHHSVRCGCGLSVGNRFVCDCKQFTEQTTA